MESRAPHDETADTPGGTPARGRAAIVPDTEAALGDRLPATERILHATVRGLVSRGAGNLSMQEVADTAGVSKGLIHYHYHDKAALVARVVEWMTDSAVSREHAALEGADAGSAVDRLWSWLSAELSRGELRALAELAHDPTPGVRATVVVASERRREAATETVERLFELLALRPRVPAAMLAETFVAFVDGLAVQSAFMPDADRRVAFDVFWLSMLGLAE